MEQSDIDKLLALREAWDKYRNISIEKTAADIDSYYKVVWSYGIERRDEIETFNEQMIDQFIRQTWTIHGECDRCKGYESTPPCLDMYKDMSCFASTASRKTVPNADLFYSLIKMGLRMGNTVPAKDKEVIVHLSESGFGKPTTIYIVGDTIRFLCPPGHGYWHDYVVPLEKVPFDLRWMP